MKVVINGLNPTHVFAKEMQIGQIAEIVDSTYPGAIILRFYNGYVNLKNPKQTWDNPATCTLKVRILPIGTKIELETEI